MINKLIIVSMLVFATTFSTASANGDYGGGHGGGHDDLITICHQDNEFVPFVKITVTVAASVSHFLHGDVNLDAEGNCPIFIPPQE